MALAGIGVDMLEIARMEHALATNPRFFERVFTTEERAYCDRCARPAEHYAARFAAHEAILKALGCGFGNGVGLLDASVGRAENGRPIAILRGRAAEIAAEQGVREIALSISHTREVAVANAVCVTDAVRPKQEEKVDAAAELAASFKEARSVIDELERLQNSLVSQETQTSQEV